jgi:hypothetical protein
MPSSMANEGLRARATSREAATAVLTQSPSVSMSPATPLYTSSRKFSGNAFILPLRIAQFPECL